MLLLAGPRIFSTGVGDFEFVNLIHIDGQPIVCLEYTDLLGVVVNSNGIEIDRQLEKMFCKASKYAGLVKLFADFNFSPLLIRNNILRGCVLSKTVQSWSDCSS